jgi:hypothetical protein
MLHFIFQHKTVRENDLWSQSRTVVSFAELFPARMCSRESVVETSRLPRLVVEDLCRACLVPQTEKRHIAFGEMRLRPLRSRVVEGWPHCMANEKS